VRYSMGHLKKLVPKKFINHIRVVNKIGWGLVFINHFFKFYRKYNNYSFSLHFTSSVVAPENIQYKKDLITLSSFGSSGGCYFQANNGIYLGNNCLFASGVKIISSSHGYHDRAWIKCEPIVIGDNVWIGTNAVILPGVKIASGSIVGAGSVVTRSFTQQNAIIAGNPAKFIRIIDSAE
jgi:acetyltransferase-like isoleucine patch superfamily enzyme